MKWALLGAIGAVLLSATKARASAEGLVSLTDDLLRKIDGRMKKGMSMSQHIEAAMVEADIVGIPRQAAFLAQVMHETGGFMWLEELASGQAYEGRKDLGNTESGDGRKFKGRGLIMITGRANYTSAGADLGLDLVNNPERAAEPATAARVAAWFWTKKGLNSLADEGKFDSITRKINGGLNGKADRDKLFARAKLVLGAQGVA
jgi:putative chitinase